MEDENDRPRKVVANVEFDCKVTAVRCSKAVEIADRRLCPILCPQLFCGNFRQKGGSAKRCRSQGFREVNGILREVCGSSGIIRARVLTQNSEETVETKRRGRIENLKPWKPGQSGNPGGRPKRDVASEIARAVFEGNEEAIYRALCKALLKGNPRLFVALAERAYGKLREAVELSGIEGLAELLANRRKRANDADSSASSVR